jgi:hypothetical protein
LFLSDIYPYKYNRKHSLLILLVSQIWAGIREKREEKKEEAINRHG